MDWINMDFGAPMYFLGTKITFNKLARRAPRRCTPSS